MIRAEPLANTKSNIESLMDKGEDEQFRQGGSLRDAVSVAMRNYLKELDGLVGPRFHLLARSQAMDGHRCDLGPIVTIRQFLGKSVFFAQRAHGLPLFFAANNAQW